MRVYDFREWFLQTGYILEITDDEAVCGIPVTEFFRESYNLIISYSSLLASLPIFFPRPP